MRAPHRDEDVVPLSIWVGLLVFLAAGCMFVDRKWTGYATSTLGLTGLILLVQRREFDRTDLEFFIVAAMLPAAVLLNMVIHGFAGSILGRPARLLTGFLAFYAIRRAGPRPVLFFDGCATGAVAGGLIAIYQVGFLGAERANAEWNAVPFGNYSLLLGVMVLCALIAGCVHGPLRLTWYGAALVLSCTALLLSKTRGSWVAVPVLLFVLSYARAGVKRRYRLGATVVLLAVAFALVSAASGLQQRLHTVGAEINAYVSAPHSAQVNQTSIGLRLAMWRWGIERFAERPLVGIGLINYDDYRRASVLKGELPEPFLGMGNVHNQLIHFLAVGGLLMASALIAFWVLAVRFFVVRLRAAGANIAARAAAVAGLCVVVGTGLFSMSSGLLGTSPDSWAFATLLCVTAGLSARRSDA